MNVVTDARFVGPDVRRITVIAPQIAKHYLPGQFVILRVTGDGERIPLTVADTDKTAGTVTLFVQGIGKTTKSLNQIEAGETISDVVGPLGEPTHIRDYGTAVVVGGGVGTAIAYPVVRALVEGNNRVVAIVGGRTSEHVLLQAELEATGAQVVVCTDDGSAGRAGFVTDALTDLIEEMSLDVVFAAGPVPMMKAVAEVTRPHSIPTVASLNPIMVDGTGMCGGCRVDVGGETKFACVDGPEFDAHLVDFDLLARRNRAYAAMESDLLRQHEASCELGTL